MTKNNKRKKHGISKRRYIRAVLLITMLLTVTAAGCSRKPSKPTGNSTTATPELTEAVTLEPTEAATPKPTEAATPKPTEATTPKPTETATPKPTETATPEPTEAVTPKPTEVATTTPKPTEAVTPKPSPSSTPAPKPTATPKPKPASSGTAFTPSGTGGRVTFTGNTVALSEAKVGDTVRFGSYEQDNDLSNGAEAIEWLVLDKQDGKLLLLSKYVLDVKDYNEKEGNVTWETCTLRSWLNTTFYETAFSTAEQGCIAMTKVRNEDNPEYGTEGGKDTEDKVFLLSIGEVLNYFDPDPAAGDPARRAKVTAYAKPQVFFYVDNAGNGWWWLRSPGYDVFHAACVVPSGNFHIDGTYVLDGGTGVCPTFWLNLESASSVPTPTPKPTPTPTPTPFPGSAFTPSGTGGRVTFSGNTVAISEAKVGDTVRYGSYEQDNDLSNGAEAIEWLVLDKQDGKLLLLSKDALDCKTYNEEYKSVTWETCTLRGWLNEEFYNTAFSQTEQGRIATTKVKNEDHQAYGTEGGNDTEDKVFLLSIGEVLNYFDAKFSAYDPARCVKVTEYAKAQGGWASSDSNHAGNGEWWLRSPGGDGSSAACINYPGNLYIYGGNVFFEEVVRPAFWLNLES